MGNLIKKFLGFSLGPVIGALISFITVPITTYFLVPEEFGKASMFSVLQALVLTFIYFGFDQSYTREYHRISNKKVLMQNAILIPLLISFFLLIFTVIFRKQFSMLMFANDNYGYISILFGIMLFFIIYERFILLNIRMEEKALEYSMFTIFLKLMVLICILFLVSIGYRDFLVVVYSAIFGQIIGDIVLILKYRDTLKIDIKEYDKEIIKKMLNFGLPLMVAASFTTFLNTSGRLFLRNYSDFHELGIYTAAMRVSSILVIVQSSFTSFWIPTAYRWDKEKKDILYFQIISRLLMLILTFGFFFVVIFKKYLVSILASEYLDVQYILPLLCLTPLLYTISETTTLGIPFSGKSYYNLIVTTISLIVNVFFNLILVPHFGVAGTAIAQGISYVFFYFLRTYYSRKCGFKLSLKDQSIVILLIFVVATINTFQFKYINLINILFLCLILLIQKESFKVLNSIIKNKEEWDFN